MTLQRMQTHDREFSTPQAPEDWDRAQRLCEYSGNPYGNSAQIEFLHRAQLAPSNSLSATSEFVGPDGAVPLPPGCRPGRTADTSLGEEMLRQMARQLLGPLADVVWPDAEQARESSCSAQAASPVSTLGTSAYKVTRSRGAGVMACNRKTTFGVGNHEYFWDNRVGESCGWGQNSGAEKGPSVDPCIDLPGSEGVEQEIMDYCDDHDDASWTSWRPFTNDCHTLADNAQRAAGLEPVDLPRFGAPGRYWEDGAWRSMDPLERLRQDSDGGSGIGHEGGSEDEGAGL